ncbi:YkgJ family cysteine cluster protein [Desulfovibrio litoralis]|uniref:Putative zinc-or iron-chelating domain-containing protein n=1 Tax=Desulfovibrio litoralis DSM 11393 TaxID=1121455 RepID=A0A1M7SH30_9BACT|nr:YkgJ family cysteine cluster protein [Desulfovibrio litoralis]SHN57760.1 Putative zinc-or iron-chelating domain-containing protein [Desulfovibrio litoralis DSM 11393]
MTQFKNNNADLFEQLSSVQAKKQGNSLKQNNKVKGASKEKIGLFQRLALLYDNMQTAYNLVAKEAGLDCRGCKDNCCYSYFRHHTFVEWAYLWRGLQALPKDVYQKIYERAKKYVIETHLAESNNTIPRLACPLLDETSGRCELYEYRLMICRLHGTKNIMHLENSQKSESEILTESSSKIQTFPGCVRYVELMHNFENPPSLDRTEFYQELAKLEFEFRVKKNMLNSRIDLTIAEMIVSGIPKNK